MVDMNDNDTSGLVIWKQGLHDLSVQMPQGSQQLNQRTLTAIRTAWINGTIIDSWGKIWVNIDYLHIILRTSKDIIRIIVGGAEDRYKQTFTLQGGVVVDCLSGTAIIAEIDRTIQHPSSMNQRMLGQFSAAIYTAVRDCPEVGVIVSLYVEHVDRQLGGLKRRRIEMYSLTNDELTGDVLNATHSHFSHIRGKRAYQELALELWNGFVVNSETHNIITKAGVQNEDHMLFICEQYKWNCNWYPLYKSNF